MTTLVAYDQRRVAALVRDGSPQQLLHDLRAGHFDATLSAEEIQELAALVYAWVQRALGPMALRDALLVDPQRGKRVYTLLCAALAAGRCPLPPEAAVRLAALDDASLTPRQIRDALAAQPPQRQPATNGIPTGDPTLAQLDTLLALAAANTLTLARYDGDATHIAYPANLIDLLPPPPAPVRVSLEPFVHPTGWRRTFAMVMALTGAALLALPLIVGKIPAQPAGMPLALLTLALMLGIRAGWAGFTGSLCIWLVANLPGFHHGTMIELWPALPLLGVGLLLLAADRRVRAMWRWIRRRGNEA